MRSTVCKSKNPRKSLCGLGSWQSSSEAIGTTKGHACYLARPHRNLRGSSCSNARMPLQTGRMIHQQKIPCQLQKKAHQQPGQPAPPRRFTSQQDQPAENEPGQLHLNHLGRKAFSCHKRAGGRASPHWLIAWRVMPSNLASAMADPAFSMACFLSILRC